MQLRLVQAGHCLGLLAAVYDRLAELLVCFRTLPDLVLVALDAAKVICGGLVRSCRQALCLLVSMVLLRLVLLMLSGAHS